MLKYRNIKTEIDGIKFDSKKEAKRYSELKMLESTSAINQLELQPQFPLYVNGEKICKYARIGKHGTIKLGIFRRNKLWL